MKLFIQANKLKAFLLLLIFYFSSFSLSVQADEIEQADTNTVNRSRLAFVIGTEVAIYTGGMLYLSEVWYADKPRVPFHFYNDNAGWLQMDKFAHSYVAYYESYWGYEALIWAGVDQERALWFGGPLGFVLQFPIEVFDGIYEGYGFSMGDVVANAFGSALFMVQEYYWQEQRILPKFSFSPSPYPELRPGTLGRTYGAQLVQDYNAQTYWFSLSPAGFFESKHWPKWLCVSLGYSGEGMLGEFENPTYIGGKEVSDIERYRQYFLTIDIDLRKIETNSRFFNALFKLVNKLKVPAPAIEFNRLNSFEFRPLYY